MTEPDFRQARMIFLREGRVVPELVDLLRLALRRLVAFGGLPPMYSPTGRWDEDAEEEVFAEWVESRLVGTGQLAALLHQSGSPNAFVRLAELYLRRHLINRLERNHATNLFARLRTLLPEDERFCAVAPSEREQDVVWALCEQGEVSVWDEAEERLLSLAWGLGEFETVRYRDDARKLSPVLERDELLRFVEELLRAAGRGLTLAQILRVLVRRFDLGPVALESLAEEAEAVAAPENVIETVEARDLAVAVIAELSQRQASVLREQLEERSVREIAERLEISVGTVAAEQRAIANVLARMSDESRESRGLLLNALRDLLS